MSGFIKMDISDIWQALKGIFEWAFAFVKFMLVDFWYVWIIILTITAISLFISRERKNLSKRLRDNK